MRHTDSPDRADLRAVEQFERAHSGADPGTPIATTEPDDLEQLTMRQFDLLCARWLAATDRRMHAEGDPFRPASIDARPRSFLSALAAGALIAAEALAAMGGGYDIGGVMWNPRDGDPLRDADA